MEEVKKNRRDGEREKMEEMRRMRKDRERETEREGRWRS